jgi:hypothetical protein
VRSELHIIRGLACIHVRASLHRVPAGADKSHGRHLSIHGETKKKLIWRADGDDASDDAMRRADAEGEKGAEGRQKGWLTRAAGACEIKLPSGGSRSSADGGTTATTTGGILARLSSLPEGPFGLARRRRQKGRAHPCWRSSRLGTLSALSPCSQSPPIS